MQTENQTASNKIDLNTPRKKNLWELRTSMKRSFVTMTFVSGFAHKGSYFQISEAQNQDSLQKNAINELS